MIDICYNEEEWEDVVGYEGIYKVSSLGNVISLDRTILKKNGIYERKRGRQISIQYNKRTNIYEVHLKKEGVRKCYKIHRLVAMHFVKNDDPDNKTTVNHIDGDRANNKACNLEWASYSENLQHAYDVLHRPVNSASAKKRPCMSIDTYDNRMFYESIAEASRNTGVSETQIRRLINHECINDTYIFNYT